ncbi:hypothetical protein ILP97_13415 [Amycolatopsis sp. H6(2020)]|nr:hypothetical protein [Amycolatopsis sp. H6(2020)]
MSEAIVPGTRVRLSRGWSSLVVRLLDNVVAAEPDLPPVDEPGRDELRPFHFLRVFKTATGRTPYRFLTRIRVERACRHRERGRPAGDGPTAGPQSRLGVRCAADGRAGAAGGALGRGGAPGPPTRR